MHSNCFAQFIISVLVSDVFGIVIFQNVQAQALLIFCSDPSLIYAMCHVSPLSKRYYLLNSMNYCITRRGA